MPPKGWKKGQQNAAPVTEKAKPPKPVKEKVAVAASQVINTAAAPTTRPVMEGERGLTLLSMLLSGLVTNRASLAGAIAANGVIAAIDDEIVATAQHLHALRLLVIAGMPVVVPKELKGDGLVEASKMADKATVRSAKPAGPAPAPIPMPGTTETSPALIPMVAQPAPMSVAPAPYAT